MVRNDNNLSSFERMALRFTRWVGSTSSIVVHTLAFIACFVLVFLGIQLDKVLLVLTTAVSLEAIYLAIFIQMTVNRNTQSLEEVEEDIDEIQKDVDEIQEDVDEIEKDVDEIQKDIDEVQKDVDEIEKDVDEIVEDDQEQTLKEKQTMDSLSQVQDTLNKLADVLEKLQKK